MACTLRFLSINVLILWLSSWRGVSYRSRDTCAKKLAHVRMDKGVASNSSWSRKWGNNKEAPCERLVSDTTKFETSSKALLDSIQPGATRKRHVFKLVRKLMELRTLMETASKHECGDTVAQSLTPMQEDLRKKLGSLLLSNADLTKKCNAAHKYAQNMLTGIDDPQVDPWDARMRFLAGMEALIRCEIPDRGTECKQKSGKNKRGDMHVAQSEAAGLTEEMSALVQIGSDQSALMERAATLHDSIEGMINEMDSTSATDELLAIAAMVAATIVMLLMLVVAVTCALSVFWVLLVAMLCMISKGVMYAMKPNDFTVACCFRTYVGEVDIYALFCVAAALILLVLGSLGR